MPYEVEFTPDAKEHFEELRAYDQGQILGAVKEQLIHTPTSETRNRKLMEPNPLADWELRVGGTLRVFYRVSESVQKVEVIAIGIKDRSRVLVGGKELKL